MRPRPSVLEQRRGGRCGLSLFEVIFSMALISITMLASLKASTALMIRQRDQVDRAEANAIAGQLMDEIAAMHIRDPQSPQWGPESGEIDGTRPLSRLRFDDVDDYVTSTFQSITDRRGQTIPGLDGWSWRCQVEPYERTDSSSAIAGNFRCPLRRVQIDILDADATPHRVSMWLADRNDGGPTVADGLFEVTVTRGGETRGGWVRRRNRASGNGGP